MRLFQFQSGLRLILCTTVLTLFCLTGFAQDKYTISGTIRDKATGETLIGATVKVKELTGGSATNAYGFFSLTLGKGNYTVLVSYAGYQSEIRLVSLSVNLQLDIELTTANTLGEIVITDKRKDENVVQAVMGVEKLNISQLNQLPVIFGEKDILKSIQLLPGIKSAGEGNSGFYVRGGGADQNLILLDEAPVYNAAHLLGFFSTFNSDALKDVTVYKGGMPAQYGGRLSSVVDIKMKDGNSKDLSVNGGIGLIASRLNIEGPLTKEKGSFIVSARRSYADVFLNFAKDSSTRSNTLYFYDLNLKANYKVGAKDKLFLSGYFGRDVLGVSNVFNTDWGNATATLRWNHVVSEKIFSNTSLIFSNYNYNIKAKWGDDKLVISSKIQDLNLKQDFDYYITNRNKLKFGANLIRHNVSPGRIETQSTAEGTRDIQQRYSWESSIYVSNEWDLSDRLNVVYGLRLSNLNVTGPGDYFSYDKLGNTTGVKSYKSGESVASYWNLEPRISFSYQIGEVKSLKASYNRNIQNLHLISNSTSANPTDLWLPGSNNIKPEIADQVSIGYFQNFRDNEYEFSVESYYKKLQNQIDYRNGANLDANDHIESELIYGSGRAYGTEFLLKKKSGLLSGWIGYTLSKTERSFAQIDNGNYFNAKQDKTHDLSVVGIYKPGGRWTYSGTFLYSTGNAVTFPNGKYQVDGNTIFLYEKRNGDRMPAYHRLDLAATLEGRNNPTRRYQGSWTFGLYNAYGRPNAFSIDFRDDPNNAGKTIAERTTLFTIVPNITWNFKF